MPIEDELRGLLQRIHAGDHQAAAELIAHYEPELRRFIRARLTDPRLHRILDSGDIFQSVFANFYVRLMAGQFDLKEPDQFFRLLLKMVRNKVIDAARLAVNRQTHDGSSAFWQRVPGAAETPSQQVINAELLEAARRLLGEDEKLLIELRAAGKTWQAIAETQGASADALRKRLRKALDRVCQQMGLEEPSHE